MDGPRRYYRKRQIPWNPKNKINKQNRNRLIDSDNKFVVARWEEVWRAG